MESGSVMVGVCRWSDGQALSFEVDENDSDGARMFSTRGFG